jgi:hypothetical protein
MISASCVGGFIPKHYLRRILSDLCCYENSGDNPWGKPPKPNKVGTCNELGLICVYVFIGATFLVSIVLDVARC